MHLWWEEYSIYCVVADDATAKPKEVYHEWNQWHKQFGQFFVFSKHETT